MRGFNYRSILPDHQHYRKKTKGLFLKDFILSKNIYKFFLFYKRAFFFAICFFLLEKHGKSFEKKNKVSPLKNFETPSPPEKIALLIHAALFTPHLPRATASGLSALARKKTILCPGNIRLYLIWVPDLPPIDLHD